MSEADKKASPWPWFLVPIAAVSLFFVLRECRQNLPPANTVHDSETTAPASPAAPAPADAQPAAPEATPAETPAPQ